MKDLNYWKNNAEEDYIQTPISVLRYITELEKEIESKQLTLTNVGWSKVFTKYGKPFTSGRDLWDWLKDNCKVVLKT